VSIAADRIEELEAENDRLNRYANAIGFCLHEKVGFDSAKAIIELQSRIEAVRKLVDECVQYQERRFQGDFDATFYLKIPRDKLREALGGKHD
jgi:hypothetical protein